MGVPTNHDFQEVLAPEHRIPLPRFVAMCDVLGFRAMVAKLSVADLATNYDMLVRQCTRAFVSVSKYPNPTPLKTKQYRPEMMVFSDTILLWSGVVDERASPDYESDFFVFVSAFFGIALKMGFPLRVGIAFGDCVIEPDRGLYLGGPLVDAYLAEEAQDWIGVACHQSCFDAPGSQNLSLLGTVVEYQIPFKPSVLDPDVLRHTIDWPFWSQGARSREMEVDLDDLLSKRVAEHTGSPFEVRWKRTLDFYRSRTSFWNGKFGRKSSGPKGQ